MNKLISQDHPEFPGLIDLGPCAIHTAHNAFGKGIEQCGKEIGQLCMDPYSLVLQDVKISKNCRCK